ncbi:MAG TPA: hypothetical protein VMH40_10565 [Myxococcaceae bacterium]|nr:hypothetical protein [Myxococcaceae bacterium]
MPHAIHLDPVMGDDERRRRLFDGDIFLYSPRQSSLALVEFTRALLREAFGPLDPETAQHEMEVSAFAELLGKVKPLFIHHPESKRLLRAMLVDMGCDPELTYFDVPRLRSSTSDQYLTTGIAYAWHPHRDTWYSAPSCQINWWMPVYELASENAMAFHPAYWARPVPNDSAKYDYYVWNAQHRGAHVVANLKSDDRPLPRATEHVEINPQIRLLPPVGGMIIFSGAQMHSSVPNTSGKTRYSVDFRIVHVGDVAEQRGAPHVDEHCTGTTMRDYLRCTDLERIPDALVARYETRTPPAGAELIYRPHP